MSEFHIGNPCGRIALWLDERDAYDLVALLRGDDEGAVELMDAIDKAYPPASDSISSDAHLPGFGGVSG